MCELSSAVENIVLLAIPVKSIVSVVAMVPFPNHIDSYFAVEKFGLVDEEDEEESGSEDEE